MPRDGGIKSGRVRTAADRDILVTLAGNPTVRHTGIVPLLDVPQFDLMKDHPEWVPPRQTNEALVRAGGKPSRSQSGSLRFTVWARDPVRASREVYATMESLVARTRFLRKPEALTYEPRWYVEGIHRSHILRPETGNVSAMSLAKTGRLYAGSTSKSIIDALQLASALTTGSDSIAVSSGWAALESLLTAQSDWSERGNGRVNVADRAACILAAAWPRSEATTLSYWLSRESNLPARVKRELETADTDNVERCRVLMSFVATGEPIVIDEPLTAASLARVRQLHGDPRKTLNRVETYMRSALRRLYRQRNIVLHGGADRSVALTADAYSRTAGGSGARQTCARY